MVIERERSAWVSAFGFNFEIIAFTPRKLFDINYSKAIILIP
jgi:hypothetical protein